MADVLYYGIYQGIVSNIKDTEKRGRIKVKCPNVLGGNVESAWCDPCIPVAYDGGGDFCIPSVDEAVWIMFIGGDVNKPVWLGGWWSKDKTNLATNYTNVDEVRIINYSDCSITMKGGKISISVGDGAGDLVIEDKKIIIEGDLEVTGRIFLKGRNLEEHKHSGITRGNSTSDSMTY